MNGKFYLILAITYALFLGPSVSELQEFSSNGRSIASSTTSNCSDILTDFSRYKYDTAVEVEIPLRYVSGEWSPNRDNFINLLTTYDGTVSPFVGKKFFGLKETAPNFLKEIHKNSPYSNEKLSKLPFDHLTIDQKHKLLMHISKLKESTFFQDRRIPGIKFRDKIPFTFKKKTIFLGQEYESGTYEINISEITKAFDMIEYMGPNNVDDVSGVELHFRNSFNSSQVSKSARDFLELQGFTKQSQHIHIVAPLDLDALKAEPTLEVAKISDFYRRTNLLAEMVEIIGSKRTIKRKADKDAVHFDISNRKKLAGVIDYFIGLSKGVNKTLGDDFKIAFVGMRGSDKYDQPNLWGIEYRTVRKDGKVNWYNSILKRLQEMMYSREYGLSNQEISDWLIHNEIDDMPKLSHQITQDYHYDLESKGRASLQSKTPASLYLQNEISPDIQEKFIKDLEEFKEAHYLLHDWSKDILVYKDQNLRTKIEKIQLKRLKQIMKVYERHQEPAKILSEVNNQVKLFLQESGLFKTVQDSFMLNLK